MDRAAAVRAALGKSGGGAACVRCLSGAPERFYALFRNHVFWRRGTDSSGATSKRPQNLSAGTQPNPASQLAGRVRWAVRHQTQLADRSRPLPGGTPPLPLPAAPAMAQPSLTGRWRKDKAQSDSMDPALDMIHMGWLYRKALALLTVMEVG